jgi:hypothetical protein
MKQSDGAWCSRALFIKPRLRQEQAWVVDAYVIDVFNDAEAACFVLKT